MTSLKHYVFAAVAYDSPKTLKGHINKPGVIIALHGPRGGAVCVAELNLSEAGSLHSQLAKILTEE